MFPTKFLLSLTVLHQCVNHGLTFVHPSIRSTGAHVSLPRNNDAIIQAKQQWQPTSTACPTFLSICMTSCNTTPEFYRGKKISSQSTSQCHDELPESFCSQTKTLGKRSSVLFASTTAPDGGPSSNNIILRVYRNTVKRFINAISYIMRLLVKPIKSILPKKSKDDTDDRTDVVKMEISNSDTTTSFQIDVAPVEEKVEKTVVINEVDDSIQLSTESAKVDVDTVPLVKEIVTDVVATSETEEVDTTSNDDSAPKKENFFMDEASTIEASNDVEESVIEESSSVSLSDSEFTTPKVSRENPTGERWAISSADVDMTAKWKIIVDEKFKVCYDKYLKGLGQPSLVRSIAVSIVELTTEEIIQSNEGREICIKGKNLRGIWERTLVSSGSDYDSHHAHDQDHVQVPLITADQETVQAEAWWEKEGTEHISWLRGGKKYGGGDFESRRYLKDDGHTLVCESTFHPRREDKEKPYIVWTFQRV